METQVLRGRGAGYDNSSKRVGSDSGVLLATEPNMGGFSRIKGQLVRLSPCCNAVKVLLEGYKVRVILLGPKN